MYCASRTYGQRYCDCVAETIGKEMILRSVILLNVAGLFAECPVYNNHPTKGTSVETGEYWMGNRTEDLQ